jgi:hypothetical protein
VFGLELEAVALVRAELGSLLPSQLHRFDESVRDRSQWNSWTGALARVAPSAVRALARASMDPEAVAVALAAHPSGRLREAALPLLAEQKTPLAVGMLVLRTADWVPAVRRVAQRLLLDVTAAGGADALLPCLPVLEQQATARARTNDFARQALDSLRRSAAEGGLRAALSDPDRRVRRSAARLLAGRADAVDVVSDALAQDDPVTLAIIAKGAVERASLDVLEELCSAAVPRVRALALYRVLGALDDATGATKADRALMDRAASVRCVAQDYLRAKGVDVPGRYVARLSVPTNRVAVETALRGLVETGSRAHTEVLLRFAAHSSARVRDSVCVGLAIWEAASGKDALVTFVADPSRRVAARAGLALARLGVTPADLERLWEYSVAREDDALRFVFTSLSRWAQVVLALRSAQVGGSPRSVACGAALLRNVMVHWNESFGFPSSDQRREILALLPGLHAGVSESLKASLMLSLKPFLVVGMSEGDGHV